jgi:hypothetical protein
MTRWLYHASSDQEQETLGIAPVFWKDEADASDTAILPLVRA